MSAILHHMDCRALMTAMAEASVDSIVTDPPYELTTARPGGRSPATEGKVMKGFMGMTWDATGIANDPALWAEALRVLKPGGYLLSFSHARTYHRMACAIEDAGFEIRDQIMWIYGSGFPKGGNRDGKGTCLKPAHEPICMARKPFKGSVSVNEERFGTGAINIDACRIGYDMADTNPATNPLHRKMAGYANGNASDAGSSSFRLKDGSGERNPNTGGRWPANIVHDGSDGVVKMFPAAPGQQGRSLSDGSPHGNSVYGKMLNAGPVHEPRGDSGSAARFFYCAKASQADRDEGLDQFDPQSFVQFQTGNGESGKASSLSEGRETQYRNIHPTVKPEALMRWLCRLITPPGGLVFDPFTGSGSTGKAAVLEGLSFVGAEMTAEYVPIARARIASAQLRAIAETDAANVKTAQGSLFGTAA